MRQRNTCIMIDSKRISSYCAYLREQEKCAATIEKYVHALSALSAYLAGRNPTKPLLIDWKEQLSDIYAAASVNSMIAAANSFFTFCGRTDLKVKPLKIQKALFCSAERELTRAEYIRLIRAAEKNRNVRLSLLLQTIGSTGIRVSELRFITARAVQNGRAELHNKGKHRIILLPEKLRRLLKRYLKKQNRTEGPVFITRTGKPMNRSNIWKAMKALCKNAGVPQNKVFPHNLRHLFARTYYTVEKDLSRLADILGHSSVNTTRIYTVESGAIHQRQLEHLGLVIT